MNPIGCSLVCFDAILNGEDVRNKRAIFERVIVSLLRVLHSIQEDKDDLIQLLTNVLGEGAPILESLDGVNDRYCAKRYSGLDHSKASNDAWVGLVKAMEPIEIGDTQWILVNRSTFTPLSFGSEVSSISDSNLKTTSNPCDAHPHIVNECIEDPPLLAGKSGDCPDSSRNKQNKQEICQDESVPLGIRETDQVMDGSQLLKDGTENQGSGPPQVTKIDEVQERIIVTDKDARSETITPEHNFAGIRAYLGDTEEFGKRAGEYEEVLNVIASLPGLSHNVVETVIKAVHVQSSLQYGDLSNNFYIKACQNGEVVIVAELKRIRKRGDLHEDLQMQARN